MTRTSRKAAHRNKKKRIALVLAPIAALAVVVPLMNQANAATPQQVADDCNADSDQLANCEFIDVQHQNNSFGPNERVSAVSDNCGISSDVTKSFSGSASVRRIFQTETGVATEGEGKLGSSLFNVGGKFKTSDLDIKRDETTSTFTYSRSDSVKADHIGFFMWSHKRIDVTGHLKATYKEPQDGETVFFSPSEGSTGVHVFYPRLLASGTPDGRLWLRNVKCGTPQADGILNSDGSLRALRTEPGFGEGGENVIDVEIPLSELQPQ